MNIPVYFCFEATKGPPKGVKLLSYLITEPEAGLVNVSRSSHQRGAEQQMGEISLLGELFLYRAG